MGQFIAILRDSFREAVDGFVIYIMIALSVIMIVLIGSLSFEPVSADTFVPQMIKNFAVVIPDRGTSSAIASVMGTEYTASDIKESGRNVSFRLNVKGLKDGQSDGFRKTVAGWLKPTGKTKKFKLPKFREGRQAGDPEGNEIEFAMKIDVTQEEAAAVTDAQMEEFLQNQFWSHAGIDGAIVRRITTGVEPPTYAFDVELKGATGSRAWPQKLGIFFGAGQLGEAALGNILYVIEDTIVNGFGAAITLMISVVITAFFIPNMVRKGSLDLLIAKPIGRCRLLIYKYIGGLTFIFLVSAFTIGGVWLVLSLRSGYWDARFLIVLPALTFTFALLYAMSTMVAVFTRSAIAAILLTLGFAFLLFLVGWFKTRADELRLFEKPPLDLPNWVYTTVDGLNTALPRYKDLGKLTSKVTAEGTRTPIENRILEGIYDYPSWGEAIGLTLAYIVVMLGLSFWRLTSRDG